MDQPRRSAGGGGGGGAEGAWRTTVRPAEVTGANPFLPPSFAIWNLALIAMLMSTVCALWLLWRLRGRDAPLRRD